MKIGAHFYTIVPHRVFDVLNIVYMKILRYHINDLVARRNKCFALVDDQLLNLRAFDFSIRVLANNISACLQAFNMVARNTYIYFTDLEIRITFITFFQCFLYGFDGLVDVEHLTMLHTITLGKTKAKYFQFAVFVLSTGDRCYFSSSNIKTNNDRWFIVTYRAGTRSSNDW